MCDILNESNLKFILPNGALRQQRRVMGYGAMTAAVKLRHQFRTLAPIYAEHNILTFPIRIADGEKKGPAVCNYSRFGLGGVGATRS